MTDTLSPTQWARSLLQMLGAPDTPNNEQGLIDWSKSEGGAGPQWGIKNNTANYNPLNTTQAAAGANSVNSAGVKSYSSWTQGLQATYQTLTNGRYNNIVTDLHNNAPETQLSSDVTSSPWGTKTWLGGAPSSISGSSNGSTTTGSSTSFVSSIVGDVQSFMVRAFLIVFGIALIVLATHGLSSSSQTPVGVVSDGGNNVGAHFKSKGNEDG